jgi:hypothetical protein
MNTLTEDELAKIRKRANREARSATTITFAPQDWRAIDTEMERLRGYLAMWEKNCTGHHGSQSSCGMTADNGVAPDRPDLTFLVARLGTIQLIAEGGLSERSLPEIARLAREALGLRS